MTDQEELQSAYQAYMNKRWPEGDCKGMYDTGAIAEIYRDAFQAGVQSQKPAIITSFRVTIRANPDCTIANIMERARAFIQDFYGVRQVDVTQTFDPRPEAEKFIGEHQ